MTSRHPSHRCLPAACVRNVLGACSHPVSVSSTSQTRPGALAHCTTTSFPQEPGSFPLDIPSPFLLGLSLLKGPCSQRMYQVASTESCRRFKPPSPSLGVLGRSKDRLPDSNCSNARCM